jgi:hypothetical protein
MSSHGTCGFLGPDGGPEGHDPDWVARSTFDMVLQHIHGCPSCRGERADCPTCAPYRRCLPCSAATIDETRAMYRNMLHDEDYAYFREVMLPSVRTPR